MTGSVNNDTHEFEFLFSLGLSFEQVHNVLDVHAAFGSVCQ